MAYSDFNDNYLDRTAGMRRFVGSPLQSFAAKSPTEKSIDLSNEAYTPGFIQQNDAEAQRQQQPFRDTIMGGVLESMFPNIAGPIFEKQRSTAIEDFLRNTPDPQEQLYGMMQRDPENRRAYAGMLMQYAQDQHDPARAAAMQKLKEEGQKTKSLTALYSHLMGSQQPTQQESAAPVPALAQPMPMNITPQEMAIEAGNFAPPSANGVQVPNGMSVGGLPVSVDNVNATAQAVNEMNAPGAIEHYFKSPSKYWMDGYMDSSFDPVDTGNIDLNNRPIVNNPDGTYSTVRSKSFNFDGKEVLLPTISKDGRNWTDKEAIENYKKTGENLGVFDTVQTANAAAQKIHEQQASIYDQKKFPQSALSQYQRSLGELAQIDPVTYGPKFLESLQNTETAQTELGKLQHDLNAGLITQDQFSAASKVGGISPDDIKLENQVRQEFEGINTVKEFRLTDTSFKRVENSYQDPSAAGDVALVFNFMKMLDPGSTVREGEFATAAASAGLGERIIAMAKKVDNGERLSPGQRKDFFDRAKMLHKGAQEGFNETAKRYQEIAKEYGMKPERISKLVNIEPDAPKTPTQPTPINNIPPNERSRILELLNKQGG